MSYSKEQLMQDLTTLKLKQSDIARMCGIARETVYRWDEEVPKYVQVIIDLMKYNKQLIDSVDKNK